MLLAMVAQFHPWQRSKTVLVVTSCGRNPRLESDAIPIRGRVARLRRCDRVGNPPDRRLNVRTPYLVPGSMNIRASAASKVMLCANPGDLRLPFRRRLVEPAHGS
jgi:hypothetical protein